MVVRVCEESHSEMLQKSLYAMCYLASIAVLCCIIGAARNGC